MEKLIPIRMSRQTWGYVLFFGAVISLLAAVVLEQLGFKGAHLSPLPFVGAVVFVKLGLFGFWPAFSQKASLVIPALNRAQSSRSDVSSDRIRSLALGDQRVDGSLFQHNVPTFVLNHEQRFLDWNPAFDLVFGGVPGLLKNSPVTVWFQALDNYKRVSKRQEKLFGEAILPLADRERATYVSPRFGRMVFTKIMTPIVDRRTGKILGWNVVLNINSVTKRQEFFTALYATLATETRRIRYAAALDGLFKAYPDYKRLLSAHRDALTDASGASLKILEIGVGAGLLTRKLLKDGHRITVLDPESELLRKLRDRCAAYPLALTIVRRDFDGLQDLPKARFERVSVTFSAHKLENLDALLTNTFQTLKGGGILALSSLTEGATVTGMFEHVRASLVTTASYDEHKQQLSHVEEWEAQAALSSPFVPRSSATLRAAAEAAGFVVESIEEGHLGGQAALLVARKP